MAFVLTNGGNFYWNNSRFRFVGVNKYPLLVNTMSQADVQAFFSACQTAGISVVRTWCFDEDFNPGNSAGNFRYLEYPTSGTNQISNGSFETNTNGWGADADYTRSNDTAHVGSYSIKQVSSSGFNNFTTTNDATGITVSPSTTYRFSVHVKMSSGSAIVYVNKTSAFGTTLNSTTVGSTGGVFAQKTFTFTTGPSDTKVWIRVQNNNAATNAYWDNFWIGADPAPALVTREASYTQLDMVLDEASNYGIKLILSLADNPTYRTKETYIAWVNSIYGSGLSTSFPYKDFFDDSNCRQLYKDFVDTLVNRVNTINARTYKNDEAIFSWELGNELRYDLFTSEGGTQNTSGSTNIAAVSSWINDVGGYIKSVDTNHLVGFGGMEHTWQFTTGDTVSNGSGYGVDYNIHSALSVIDYLDFHFYPTQDGANTSVYPSGETDILPYGQRVASKAAPIKQSGSATTSKVVTLNSASQVGDIFIVHAAFSAAQSPAPTVTDSAGNTYTLTSSSGDNKTHHYSGTQATGGATTITVSWTGSNSVTVYVDEYGGRDNTNNSRTISGIRAQIEDYIAVAKANGKPVIMGETGFSRDVIRSNVHYPLYPRVDAFEEIFGHFFNNGGDGICLWHGEITDSTSYTINFTGSYDNNTTNDNFDDRPLAALITQRDQTLNSGRVNTPSRSSASSRSSNSARQVVRDLEACLDVADGTQTCSWGNILMNSDTITVAFLFKPRKTGSSNYDVQFGYSNNRWFFLYQGATRQLGFNVRIAGAEKGSGYPAKDFQLDKWYLVTGRYDSGGGANNLNCRIYDMTANGALWNNASTTQTGSLSTTAVALKAGFDFARTLNCNAEFDDIRVWDRVLTDTELDKLAQGVVPSSTSLALETLFDEGTGTTAADTSGNGRDATLSSGAGWNTDVYTIGRALT